MDELTEIRAEALKSAVEEKLKQFYTELDDIFKAYNATDLNNTKPSSSFQKDEGLEDKQEVKDDGQKNWAMKILLTSKEMSNKSSEEASKIPERLHKCKIVSVFPNIVIECD